jgi:class 3 adenylate cyclase/tetratricopeptide (TPR) repeat protein
MGTTWPGRITTVSDGKGHLMTTSDENTTPGSPAPEALQEMTVLFTDVVASTQYFKTYGDIAGRKMLQRHQDMASAPVIEHSGVVVKTLGDSVMAYFADPREAVRAAVRIQQQLARFNGKRETAHQIHVRIAMHIGEGIVEERDIFGNVVNITAKLLPLAGADEIFISAPLFERVRDLAPLAFEPVDLKGGNRALRKMSVQRVLWKEDIVFDPTTSFLLLLRPLAGIGGRRQEGLWKSLQRIQQQLGGEQAQKVETRSDGSLAFIFKTVAEAVDTALNLVAVIEQRLGPDHRFVPIPFQILIDTGPFLRANRIMLEDLGIDWQLIDPGEINVTVSVFRLLKKDPHYATCPPFDADCPERTYHLFHAERRPLPGARFFLYHHTMAAGNGAPCYYCGARSHRAAACPSKTMLDSPMALRRLAQMGVRDINRLFRNAPPAALPATPSPAAGGQGPEKSSLASRAFYELTSVFHLSLFVSLWASPETDWERIEVGGGGGPKGGPAWLGLDRLRFSDQEQARSLLNTATRESPDDYQAYCALGFLNAERGAFANAHLSFNEAIERTRSGPQRIYLYFQRYRLYCLQESWLDAAKMLVEIRRIDRHCNQADYCGVQVDFGRGRHKDALGAMENLIEKEPAYYVRFLIDPAFLPYRQHVQPRLATLFKKQETRAKRLIPKAGEALAKLETLIGDSDVILYNARIAWERIITLDEQGSYCGYLEMIRNATDIMSAGRRYIDGKKRVVKRELTHMRSRCERRFEIASASSYAFLSRPLVESLGALLDQIEQMRTVAERDDASLLTAAEKQIAEMKKEEKRIQARVKRLDTLEEALDFGLLFFKRSVIIQAVNGIIALLLLPLVAYYLSLIVPGLMGLQKKIWEYQVWFLLLGGLFGIVLALRLTLTRLKKKASPRKAPP